MHNHLKKFERLMEEFKMVDPNTRVDNGRIAWQRVEELSIYQS